MLRQRILIKVKLNMFSLIVDNNGRIISFEDKKYIGTYIKDYTSGKVTANDNTVNFESIN